MVRRAKRATPEQNDAAVRAGCYFDVEAVARVYTFFTRFLRHSIGHFAGQPFTPCDWQLYDVLGPLYGWRRKDGTRRFRDAEIWIPKKNGKSTLCSALIIYHLIADGEPGAEVYSAANDRDQASIVYREAVRMVKASDALAKFIRTVDSKRELHADRLNALFRSLSSDVPTKEGLNASALIYDELHAAESRQLWDTLKYAGAARRQPLRITISTAGYDRDTIGYERYTYAKRVLSGEVDDWETFAYVREAGEKDDPFAEETWRKANPSLGVTIPVDDMARAARTAQSTPSELNAYLRYRLNIWTQQEIAWLPVADWDACYEEYTEDDLAGEECFSGLDLASTNDLAAFALFFPASGRTLYHFWVPEEGVARRAKSGKLQRIGAWCDAGYITVTPGRSLDYKQIEDAVCDICNRYRHQKLGCDRWNATQTIINLMNEGVEVQPVGQGYFSMSGPSKLFEAAVLNKRIKHNGNPVMRWMFGNVVMEGDAAANIKPSKKKSAEKIDGVVALIMALGQWMVSAEDVSIYERQGLDVIEVKHEVAAKGR